MSSLATLVAREITEIKNLIKGALDNSEIVDTVKIFTMLTTQRSRQVIAEVKLNKPEMLVIEIVDYDLLNNFSVMPGETPPPWGVGAVALIEHGGYGSHIGMWQLFVERGFIICLPAKTLRITIDAFNNTAGTVSRRYGAIITKGIYVPNMFDRPWGGNNILAGAVDGPNQLPAFSREMRVITGQQIELQFQAGIAGATNILPNITILNDSGWIPIPWGASWFSINNVGVGATDYQVFFR